MLKSHTCGELTLASVGQRVTLAGWVNRRRDHGGLIFIDLRDRFGVTQVTINTDQVAAHDTATQARSEFVIQVEGTVAARPEGLRNPNLATGDVEVIADGVTILNPAKNPPFNIAAGSNPAGDEVDEMLRLKYRYLDIRRARMTQNLVLRHRIVRFIREYLSDRDFLEIETPILLKSTPEGARDFVVPSRLHPGEFYALPQSPQQLKQLLMVAGIERYFQIARCFRDEDLRADRQPEFTQLDLEMSFVDAGDIRALIEGLLIELTAVENANKRIMQLPFPIIQLRRGYGALRHRPARPALWAAAVQHHADDGGEPVRRLPKCSGERRRNQGRGLPGRRAPHAPRDRRADRVCQALRGQGFGVDRRGRRAGRVRPLQRRGLAVAGGQVPVAGRTGHDRAHQRGQGGRPDPDRGGQAGHSGAKPEQPAARDRQARQSDRPEPAGLLLGGGLPAAGVRRRGRPLAGGAPSLYQRTRRGLGQAGERSRQRTGQGI